MSRTQKGCESKLISIWESNLLWAAYERGAASGTSVSETQISEGEQIMPGNTTACLFLCTYHFPYTSVSGHFQRSDIMISTWLNGPDLSHLFCQRWALCKWHISIFSVFLINLKNSFVEGCYDHMGLWEVTCLLPSERNYCLIA